MSPILDKSSYMAAAVLGLGGSSDVAPPPPFPQEDPPVTAHRTEGTIYSLGIIVSLDSAVGDPYGAIIQALEVRAADPALDQSRRRLLELRRLRDGWDGHDAEAPNASALANASRLIPNSADAFAAPPFTPQELQCSSPPRANSAWPISKRKIEPRWLPPPPDARPRCCPRRWRSVERDPSPSAWVPTRTIRKPSPLSLRTSEVSKNKYTPLLGQSRKLLKFASARVPPARCLSWSSSE